MRGRNLDRVDEFRRRFEKLSSAVLRDRLNWGALVKEAQTAILQILEQRGRADGDDDEEPGSPAR